MQTITLPKSRALLVALLALWSGLPGWCRSAAAVTNAPAWPPPPAAPCIVYVRDISAPKDIGAKAPFFTRVADALTGVASSQKKFARPFGLSLDEAGNLTVTDTGIGAVYFLDFAKKKWLRWTTVGGQRLVSPVSAVHAGKTFLVADSALGEVIAFDEKGKGQFVITNDLQRPVGLALSGDKLFIVDSEQHAVLICNLHGELLSQFGRRGLGDGEFNFPTHVATDRRGQVYVTDSLNQRIQVFDADGHFLRAFGSAGDGPGHFTRPKGVAVDAEGHIYVVDAVFGNVQIFNDRGRILLDFGGLGSNAGEFSVPNAIAINSRDEIFVSDGFNHRVQEFRYTGREGEK